MVILNSVTTSGLKIITVSVALALASTHAAADTYAPWLTQIGINDYVMSAGNWGYGQKLGVVDTGIDLKSIFFAPGQVSNVNSGCSVVRRTCPNGAMDDAGHGTAVAEIAAGNIKSNNNYYTGSYLVLRDNVISVAPNANIIARKVLDKNGSGYASDVALGITDAANAGASVINVSISFASSSKELIQSINYAASKGAFVVFAGGNDAASFVNGGVISGLSKDALKRLIIVGAVDSKNRLAHFSNTPGSSQFSNGETTKVASRWLVAPGQDILAPYNPSAPGKYGYWSGTSMSAPVVSGSLLLLNSAWPILKTNGTAIDLLIATATDLGVKGADSTFGNGLINLGKAFQPYGALKVTGGNGQLINVSAINGALLSSNALGPLNSIKAKLENYQSFDEFQRNFTVNLSGMIKNPKSSAIINPVTTYKRTAPMSVSLAGGSTLTLYSGTQTQEDWSPFIREVDGQSMYFALENKDGSTFAMANHYPSQYAFSQSLYGSLEMASMSSDMDLGFASLMQSGSMAAFGTKLNENTRMAFSWSGTSGLGDGFSQSQANLLKVGVSHRNNGWLFGMSAGLMSEEAGLLGSQYQNGSAISFGQRNASQDLTVSVGYNFNPNTNILFEAGLANTDAAKATGIITGTSAIQSNSFGATLSTKNLLSKGDVASFSIKQPMRVASGSANLMIAGVDENGVATYHQESVGLSPEGREIDLKLTYDIKVSPGSFAAFNAQYRQDMMNQKGVDGYGIGVNYTVGF